MKLQDEMTAAKAFAAKLQAQPGCIGAKAAQPIVRGFTTTMVTAEYRTDGIYSQVRYVLTGGRFIKS